MRALLLFPLLAACRYEPLGWWNITQLDVEIDGGETVEVPDAGFVQIASDGGDYATYLIRYELIPTLEGTVSVYPKTSLVVSSGNWEMEGAQDFSLSLAVGESGVTLLTDDTLGAPIRLASEEPVPVYVPSTWTGEGAGSGAIVSATFAMQLDR